MLCRAILTRMPRASLAAVRWQPCRALCKASKPEDVSKASATSPDIHTSPSSIDGKVDAQAKPATSSSAASAAASPKPEAATAGGPAKSALGPDAPPGGDSRSALTLSEEEEAAPPPMEWEPGVAGTVQKGLSAVVIAFGAAAFAVCAGGAYWALFPSASSPGVIFEEAADKVKMDPEVADRLGTPIRAFGADFGGGEGRRNFVQSWEVEAPDGSEAVQVKFNIQGPMGRAVVHAQAPKSRKRGDFYFVVYEGMTSRRKREMFYILDNRPAKAAPVPPPPPTPAASST